MSIVIIGNGGTQADVDGTTYRALKVTVRPVDFGLRGSYAMEANSDPTGGAGPLGPAGVFFTVQWIDPIIIALVWSVQLKNFDLLSGTPDAAGLQTIGLYVNRQYTAPATGGDVTANLGAGNKLKTLMSSSLMSNIVRTSVNGTATPGTSFSDSQPIGQAVFSTPGAVAQSGNQIINRTIDLYGQLERKGNAVPLVLGQNEGFTVTGTLINLTNVNTYSAIHFDWSEVAFY